MSAAAPAFVHDLATCVGCHACVVAYAVENGTPPGRSRRRVVTFNEERLAGRPVSHLSLACNHGLDAPCERHCPALAVSRDVRPAPCSSTATAASAPAIAPGSARTTRCGSTWPGGVMTKVHALPRSPPRRRAPGRLAAGAPSLPRALGAAVGGELLDRAHFYASLEATRHGA